MDLASFQPVSAGVEMQLRHPDTNAPLSTEDGKPITISLLGRDSPAYRRANQAARDASIRQQQRGKLLSASDIDDNALDIICACTVGWANITLNGKALEYSRSNVKELYTTLPWVYEQAEAFITTRANFLKASSPNS